MRQKIVIAGPKVHDVGYRVFLLNEALKLDFEKFNAVNEIKDSNQIIEVLLDGEKSQLNQFLAFAEKHSPPLAQVTFVKSEEYQGRVMDIDRYLHVIQVQQLDKGIRSIESIDKKQSETTEEIRGLREDLIERSDRRFARIESDIAAIKTRLEMV